MRNRSTGRRGALMIGLMILALGAIVPTAGGAEPLVDSGILYLGAPKSCASPIDNCSRSRLTGAVKRYKFTAQTVEPAQNDPSSVILRGNSIIKFRDGGRLFSSDIVRVNLATGDVVHVWTITGGSGRHAGTTGSMAAGGNLGNVGVGIPYNASFVIPDE